MVMLQSQNCDCGEDQAKHLPCSHVMIVCKSVNVDLTKKISRILIQGKRGPQRIVRLTGIPNIDEEKNE